MDPTELFPAEIIELIFHNLRGQDLLESTLVKASWNRHIGTSLTCMGKIVLRCGYTEEIENQSVLSVVSSDRKYRNIRITAAEKLSDIHEFMTTRHFWVSVLIEDTVFPTSIIFNKFLETFEAMVEILIVTEVSVGQDLKCDVPKFPRLLHCYLQDCDNVVSSDLLKNCDTLRTLLFTDLKESVIPNYFFETILVNQKHLKHLEYCGRVYDVVDDITFPFQLEKLGITETTAVPVLTDWNHYTFVKSLLKNQKNLKELLLGDSETAFNALSTALKMQSLTDLSVTKSPLPIDAQFIKSRSIINLMYFWIDKHYKDQINVILNAIPKPANTTLIHSKKDKDSGVKDIQQIFPNSVLVESTEPNHFYWVRKGDKLLKTRSRASFIRTCMFPLK